MPSPAAPPHPAPRAGEHKTNEGLLAINPRGQAPAFKDGDVTVNESLAAMLYLDDAYAEQPLMPKSGAARALALQRFVEADVLYQAIRPLFAAKMRGQVNTDEQKVRAAMPRARRRRAHSGGACRRVAAFRLQATGTACTRAPRRRPATPPHAHCGKYPGDGDALCAGDVR